VKLSVWAGNCSNSSFVYGNGNLTMYGSKLILGLSNIGNINNIIISMLTGCHDEINIISDNTIIEDETVLGISQTFYIYEYMNVNNELIDYLEILNVECPGAVIFDITIDYEPICESTPISNVRNGDVYLNDACYGVIMTSPSGNCFRAKVADNGMLFTEPVECP